MLADYRDIRDKIPEEPLWFDSNGVPRYAPFDTELLPDIYCDEAVLLSIKCQACEKVFAVALQGSPISRITDCQSLAEAIVDNNIHFGDPPCHDCAGATMNCIDIAVLQFWERTANCYEWQRRPDLEGPIKQSDSA